MPKPVCFMIMPYGRKRTHVKAGCGPAEIDFEALWGLGYVPVLEALGYKPVRADQDNGALIISQMLERLYFAELVLADMTIPNGNVYYEVGIRHAARDTGCVLFAADWSRQLLDVMQMRTIRYPLPEGNVTEPTAEAFKNVISDGIRDLARGISPMYQSIPGYPTNVNPRAATTMRDQMADLAAFQTKVRAVRAAPRSERMELAKKLVATDGIPPITYPVALALLGLMRDSAVTTEHSKFVLDFARTLPREFREQAEAREQLVFAAAYKTNLAEVIAELETLIATNGPTPERLGMLGGRYRRLMYEAPTPGERLRYLNKAIEAYEQGMDLDLNDYYCSAPLPHLYRMRNRKGDEACALRVSTLAIAAAERLIRRGVADEWLRPGLLQAAFDAQDMDKAEQLADDVVAEGTSAWKVETTRWALEDSAARVTDSTKRARLLAVIARLNTAQSSHRASGWR